MDVHDPKDFDLFVEWLKKVANRAITLAHRMERGRLTLGDEEDLREFHDLWYDGHLEFEQKKIGQ